MQRVPRHTIPDMALVEERRQRAVQKTGEYVVSCRETGKNWDLMLMRTLMAAQNGAMIDGISHDVGRAIRLSADASACIFAAACEPPVRPTLQGISLTNVERSHESLMNVSRWIKAFFLNALCRNASALKLLSSVPMAVIGDSSTQGARCRLIFSGDLRMFLSGRPEAVKLLVQSLEATDPDKYNLIDAEWVLHFDTHQINLLGQVMAQNADFEERLANALEVHKEYWSKTKDRRMDPDGFLAIELLGIAALAYDRGMRFEIESEYLPMHLVDGSFLSA